ncbi:MAG: hypothetical protein HQL58_04285 [Magnetococcales bacterium]|nr:hypothetical protein [Magnetococcales bacterium]
MVSAVMQQHLAELTQRVDRHVHAEAGRVSPAQQGLIRDQIIRKIGRMKWVDEYVIATALLLLRHEQPDLFSEQAAVEHNSQE